MAQIQGPAIERFNVLGVGVSAITLASACRLVLEAMAAGRKGYVCVTGVHGVSEAQADPEFRRILNAALLNTPDGMPLVWLGRRAVGRTVDRVYGPDLMLELCAATEHTEYTHFFYGGGAGVAEALGRALRRRFPALKIAGAYTPPFRPLTADEEIDIIARVRTSRPSLFWVGLSTPKQERFMAANLPKLDTGLMLGVGAAFDFHTGRVRQAPRWIQRAGLEWLFRLGHEPRRLWKRYLKNNPLFILRVFAQLTGLRAYPLGP
jgi:N-acetylglucosaminyldiphosphoundecaprenol N-acetyl-beta-D-mannosaminyltransferase